MWLIAPGYRNTNIGPECMGCQLPQYFLATVAVIFVIKRRIKLQLSPCEQ